MTFRAKKASLIAGLSSIQPLYAAYGIDFNVLRELPANNNPSMQRQVASGAVCSLANGTTIYATID
uniref:Uncharacterized protein n=1 Tax=uncultured Thiotrichaceae bacterium TaxID=298394 RepID=A0A6S6U4P2_9GAMM|nr:MAG: Unknown protein [uncultured Thiotrichaceae bacterium]